MKGLLLTYAVVAIGSIVALRYPALGLGVYVGFSMLRPEALWGWAGPLNYCSRIIGVAMLIGWALRGFGSWKLGPGWSAIAALIFFLFWSILSTIQAIDSDVGTEFILEFLKTLLPLLVGVTMLKSEAEARQILWAMVLAQAYVCLEMNRAYLEGYNRVFDQGFGGMDNNTFGISLVTTMGAAVGLTLGASTWRGILLGAGSALLILHTILLTFSRGSFVGLIGVAVVAMAIMPKRPKYLGAVLALALVAFYFTGPELSARYGTTFVPREERDGSAESRLDLWRDCFTVVASRPVFGVGPQNWPLIAEEFGWNAGKEAHSLWIQSAAEF